MLNSANQVISAQDYDAWGYPLENRTYNSSTMRYDFTGKERDNETSYDYFGARYYDSRIGRWGGVEPLLDKYPGVSPYLYGMLNPLKFFDVNGKDGLVAIEGNKITITSGFYYSTEGTFGFNTSETKDLFITSMDEAAQLWTDAGKHVEFEGKNYEVEFKVDFTEVSSSEISEMWSGARSIPEGMNIAYLSNSAREPGVYETGNALRIVPEVQNATSDKLFMRIFTQNWASHELGHLLGQEHELKETYNIMSYSDVRNSPEEINVKRILKQIDFSKTRQVLKGVQGE